MELFWISVWFSRKFEIFDFLCFFFWNFKRIEFQKLSMLERKQRQYWDIHRIKHKTIQSDFRFLIFFFNFSFQCFQKYAFFDL